MWLLLTAASLISTLGTTHALFGKLHPTNPEVTMNISQMITYWGYPTEEYEVVTEDGYILGIDRIPYGRKNSENIGRRPVAFLQHGLLTSATNWISNLPNNSLAFILADAGYDVWLGNSRGNTWARRNLYYSPDSVEFWAFSFDKMAKYDLPTTIDFILKKTGQDKLHYVGHSQGTTIGFIAFSTNPKLAKRIKTFYALAPVATVKYTQTLLNKLMLVPSFLFKLIFGNKIFYPHHFFDQFLATEVCSRETVDLLCSNALFIICGSDTKNLNMETKFIDKKVYATPGASSLNSIYGGVPKCRGYWEQNGESRDVPALMEIKDIPFSFPMLSRLDVYLSHNPAGTSVQNVLHWSQAVKSGKFQAFDWGSPVQNMMHYHQSTPPYYNLTDMHVPIAVWNGGNDLLADPHDVDLLLSKFPNLIYHRKIPPYNHLDFIWAMDAPQAVYNEIVSMMGTDNK